MDPKEAASREQKLNNLITQINFLFFESNSKKLDLFALAQNIYRELNVFETISWFINDNQRRIKESAKNKHDIFSTCFLFISYYLKDNE